MFPRHLIDPIRTALRERPVVLLLGARQVGKSTLAQGLVAQGLLDRYLTLDDLALLAAALEDPQGFLAGLRGRVVLDEVQRAPGLLLPLKALVDRERRPGRFLLTGSANLLALPKASEFLVGRVALFTLWPLSQGEMEGRKEGFLAALFGEELPPIQGEGRLPLDRLLRGGYPEAVGLSPEGRGRWFRDYLATLLAREVRELSQIERLPELARLYTLLAGRPMALLNWAELGRSLGLPATTLKRYFALLETLFLVRTLPPWEANLGKRLVKSPKVHPTDTGLALHTLGLDAGRLETDRSLLGGVLEAFVAMEITKQAGYAPFPVGLFHYRSHTGEEVDLLLEGPGGRVVGLEVKARGSVRGEDFRGLKGLAQALGPRFHRGVVLYLGRESVPFGPNLHALPLEALWRL
ncbi:ATP-binding protein [Thermus oshimai]|uniref:ATP-binding protein n=1 Tax=Thermus oshimai TaxID=56957 RepID=UPI0003743DAB|nr:ATP-binding protein [Thermus oshimai]